MRPELEQLALIGRYLNDELDPQARAAFEAELRNDASLRESLRLQSELAAGMRRGPLRRNILRARARYRQKALLKQSVSGLLAATALIVAGIWIFGAAESKESVFSLGAYATVSPVDMNKPGTRQLTTADSLIVPQRFLIDAGRDTIIATNGGMVLAIAAGSFVDASGSRANGPVSLYLREALDAVTIMKSGLSTMSDGRLLETGGMFSIDVQGAAGALRIDPAKPVYAALPAARPDPDMMLFKGIRQPDGGINWTDPQPLVRDLVPVDMKTLDFYPTAYLPALAEQGYPATHRSYSDSVYYSMAQWFEGNEPGRLERSGLSASAMDTILAGVSRDSVRTARSVQSCGVNPASIRTLRSGSFDNTLIATREFEQRLRLIHLAQSQSQSLLDLYVRNLGRNLWEIDSMASMREQRFTKEFKAFAAQRLGKVRAHSAQTEMLGRFYGQQTALFTNAVAAAQRAIRGNECCRDREFQQKRESHTAADQNRVREAFAQELSLNLNAAYRRLGYPQAPAVRIDPVTGGVSAIRTTVAVSSTGWHNVDKFALVATATRRSMDYVDPKAGDTLKVRYEPLNVDIAEATAYDRLLVYLLPDKLSSFMRLDESGGSFSAQLNQQISYDLVCVAYKGNQSFFFSQNNIRPQSYTGLRLQPVDSQVLETRLRAAKAFGASMSLLDDAGFEQFRLVYSGELRQRRAWTHLMETLRRRLYPCLTGGENSGGFDDETDVNRDGAPIPDGEWINSTLNYTRVPEK